MVWGFEELVCIQQERSVRLRDYQVLPKEAKEDGWGQRRGENKQEASLTYQVDEHSLTYVNDRKRDF